MSPNTRQPDRPTLREVAAVAGLSVTQTSRALNGHSDVAAATRQRALAAAHEVGYMPNLEARRLKVPTARAHSIGLVLSSPEQRFSDPFLGDLLTAIARQAAHHDFELQLSTPVDPDGALAVYQRAIRTKRVDGFILLRVASDDQRVRFLLDQNVPFVTLGRPADMSGFPSVSESPESLTTTIEHLTGLGHRSIGVVALPPGFAMAEQRLVSFNRAMEAAGLDVSPDDVVTATGYHQDSGLAAATVLLSKPNPPTAIIAFNDFFSIGVMRAARALDLDIPRDLSLIAVDDTIMAGNAVPPLTAVRNPAIEYGEQLVTHLLAAIDNGLSDHRGTVRPELILRSSTATPRPQ